MKNKLTKEEQLLQEKLNSVEFDYQDAHWTEMQEMLGKKGFFSKYSSVLKGAAVVIATSSMVYWLNSQYQQNPQEEQISVEQQIEENSISKDIQESNPDNISTTSNIRKDNSVEDRTSSVVNPIEDVSSTWLEEINPSAKSEEEKPITEEVAVNENPQREETPLTEITADKRRETLADFEIEGKQCLGEKVILRTKASTDSGQIDWYVNGKRQENKGNSMSVAIQSQDRVIVSAYLIIDGSIVDEKKTILRAAVMPEVDFTYEDQTNVYYDFHAKLRATPAGLSNYQWKVDGEKISSEGQYISHPFGRKGIYDVRLEYESPEGCISSMEKPVAIEQDFKTFVNAFSPNGDGDNDVFFPKMFEIVEGEFQMTIFDRGGAVVYFTNSLNSPWNGRRNNTGEMLPVGTYVMKVKIQNEEGIVRNFTETFKLVEF